MDRGYLIPLLPTLQMIAEELQGEGWVCDVTVQDMNIVYSGIRLYHGQKNLRTDILYLLRPTETGFPTDQYSYVSTSEMDGRGNHLVCSEKPDEVIMDRLLDLFSQYQQWQQQIDALTYRNSGVQELCELGSQMLDNPVCIHDDWFIMIAMSQGMDQIMEPEYAASSNIGSIPRAIVEDFRNDGEYLETYVHRNAQVWKGTRGEPDSLYVNLWDGAVYRGRFLVLKHNHPFRKVDFVLAEVLAQRITYLLNRKKPGENMQTRSMDDVIFGLLQNKQTDTADLTQLMNMLNWGKQDRFLCVRIRNQQESAVSAMEHVLHSDLFRIFSDSYILFSGHEQCILLNLTKNPMKAEYVSHLLAPLCRDYCLYAGISSPVTDIRDVHLAYYQAEVAINQAFRMHSERWIVTFSSCALSYIFENLNSPLQKWHLAAPELHALKDYDQEKGTQYFETFRTYLQEERDIPRTAQKLIIHRTTLLYRLKKIQQIIADDLNDPWKRMYFLLSLWLMDQEENG